MVPSWVSGYIGVPFVSGGRDISGCDCYGLVRLVLLDQFGYRLPLLDNKYKNACAVAEAAPLVQRYTPLLTGTQLSKPESGALAVIQYFGRTSHVGIFVDDECILHTLLNIGAHCIVAGNLFLRGGIKGIYRVSEDYRVTPSV
jgi:cell wall-associated NlpC family hydrolase